MPYVITTGTVEPPPHGGFRSHTRLAVATLDEARTAVLGELTLARFPDSATVMDDDRAEAVRAAQHLPVAGGAIGPLPDGTVIEVVPVPLTRLFDEMRHAMTLPPDATSEAAILAAFNARQEG